VVLQNYGIDELTRFATETIQQTGEKALSYYGKGKSNLKFDDDLVTQAELDLTAVFQNRLNSQFPDHQIFNNNHEIGAYTHEGKRYLWIFDPLDGVANFQAGIPIWGMSLALLENAWPIFGAFFMPTTGDLFYARGGDKVYWGDAEISVSDQDTLNDESLFLAYSRFHHYYHSTFPGKIRNLGCTTAHVCYVAMGRAEAAIITSQSYKDIAAARIIIEAAGGKIYKIDGSEFFPNEYLEGKRIDDHLLVAYPDIFQQVVDCLQEVS